MNTVNKPYQNMSGAIVAGIIVIVALASYGIYNLTYYYAYKQAQMIDNTTQTSVSTCSSCQQAYYASWQNYDNSRYEFSIKLPKEYIGEESENGDGKNFINNTNSNIKVNVYAKNNSEGENLDSYLKKTTDGLKINSQKITKQEEKQTYLDGNEAKQYIWHYTDENGQQLIKIKTGCLKDNVFYMVEMTCPEEEWTNQEKLFEGIENSLKIK